MDAGAFDSLCKATNFVSLIEQYQGMTISAPEEIAYRFGWIDDEMLKAVRRNTGKPIWRSSEGCAERQDHSVSFARRKAVL